MRRAARRPALALAALAAACGLWLRGHAFAGARAPPAARHATTRRAIRVPNAPKEGEREVVDGPDGPIIVANLGGAYYAVDATCPHLGLPMKRGKIEETGEGPILTCNFHNSCFNMQNGRCTKWVTGAMGFENDFVSGIMGNLGNPKSDIRAYKVLDPGDGYIWVETDAQESVQSDA